METTHAAEQETIRRIGRGGFASLTIFLDFHLLTSQKEVITPKPTRSMTQKATQNMSSLTLIMD
jgi:hypothetical protein